MSNDTINYMLKEACPSIQYRINSEVFGVGEMDPNMIALQNKILEDKVITKIFEWQQPNGYLGTRFHTSNSKNDTGTAEIGIRLLCEKGVRKDNYVLAKALKALEGPNDKFALELYKLGEILDSSGLGGSNLIRAVLFAYAGVEDKSLIKEQVESTLRVFERIANIQSISDISETYKDKLIFKNGFIWPCIYHLRLLAFTEIWRSDSNYKIVIEGLKQLFKILPLQTPHKNIYLKFSNQLILPCMLLLSKLNIDFNSCNDNYLMYWFERMELLARMGVIKHIPDLSIQLANLQSFTRTNNGLFIKQSAFKVFNRWSAYNGLALENDWNKRERGVCDLTFRSLLIEYYSNRSI